MNAFGTVTWAIDLAKVHQKRAIARIAKNKKGASRLHRMTPYARTIVDIIARPSKDARFEKGYIILSENQLKEANGQKYEGRISDGKKFICSVDVDYKNRLQIIPLR